MVIQPEIVVTPDCPTVKFRENHSNVDLDKEIPRILHAQGWEVGTYFHVHFLNHERNKLLKSGAFIVTEVVSALHVSETNPYQPITKEIYTRKAEQVGDWWYASDVVALSPLEGETARVVDKEAPFTPVAKEPFVKWNLGKQMHQLIADGKVIYESKDKGQVMDHMKGMT